MFPAQCPAPVRARQVSRVPSRTLGVTAGAVTSLITSASITSPSSLLRTHAPVPMPPPASGFPWQAVLAGCRQPRLAEGPSRRYLCRTFPACLDPYPGRPWGALTRFFPQGIGLLRLASGSAPHNIPDSDFRQEEHFEAAAIHSRFKPTGLLATLVAPTLIPFPHRAVVASTSAHITGRYLPMQRIC